VVNFNRRYKRTGHLFQNRYKSIVCQEDTYLRELVRYLHLNPVRAGMVGSLVDLDQFAYCGHGVLMGNRKQPWQDVEYVLRYFGDDQRNARKEYHRYVEAGLGQGRRDELAGGGLIRSLGGWKQAKRQGKGKQEHFRSDERILGDSHFVSAVLSEAKERFERKYELKRQGYDLDRIVARASEVCGLSEGDIFLKGKQPNRVKARSLLCYWAVREFVFPVRKSQSYWASAFLESSIACSEEKPWQKFMIIA
jgi:REP-associated tyrosine transposase